MKRKSRFPLFLTLGLLFGAAFWLHDTKELDKIAPQIDAPEKVFWNFQEPLKISLKDRNRIRNYRLYELRNGERNLLESVDLDGLKQQVTFEIPAPKNVTSTPKSPLEFEIESTDGSWWNFFKGNTATHKITAIIDTKRPILRLIAHSYGITKGGSALVIFRAEDEFLKSIQVSNGKDNFSAKPFYKEGYYAALIAWPTTQDEFNASIRAIDLAGNLAISNINFVRTNKNYRQSQLKLKDSFIDGKISALIQEIDERALESFENGVEKFKYINEEVRASNEQIIAQISRKAAAGNALGAEFAPLPFYPLRHAAVVANFGDHRFFEYGGKIVSESHHLGLDLASVKNAPIFSTNKGAVLFTGFLGIYGNIVLIDHGLGLVTLYAHMSEINVQKGESVAAGTIIGKTGISGLALGDHLHFGIIVQGKEVSCIEWMDARWIKENILDVLARGRNFIDSQGVK